MFNPFLEIKKNLLTPDKVYDKCDNRNLQFGKRLTIHIATFDACYGKTMEDCNTIIKARKHMETMMGGQRFINVWLRSVLPKHERLATYRLDLMAAYQHRWLDHLAQQYESGEILDDETRSNTAEA